MASSLTTEIIIEAIKKKLVRLCPRGGWPSYGGVTVNLVFHDSKVADPVEVTVKDKTKEDDAED